jgi:hypothetical protein
MLAGILARFNTCHRRERYERMCFAGIEEDVQKLADKVAAKTEVHAIAARVDHGHLHVLVENQGWIRSVDLLQQWRDPGFEPVTRPLSLPRSPRQPAVSAGR